MTVGPKSRKRASHAEGPVPVQPKEAKRPARRHVPPRGQGRWMDHFNLKRNAGWGTTHRSQPFFSLPSVALRAPSAGLKKRWETGTFYFACFRNFLFCVDSRERLKARHQQIVIKSSADRQPRMLHRNDQANFGICGHGLRGHLPAAGPSFPGGRVRHDREKELSGPVTSVKFTNPHGSPALAVKNQDGSSTEWVMPPGSVIMPDGRAIQTSAGNPND
jgi:hypothetical protein